MPMKASPPLVAAASWTGFYVGGNVGYSWGDLEAGNLTLNGNTIYSSGVNVDGVIGGGQVGYNWQTGNFVVGLEADIQGHPGKMRMQLNRIAFQSLVHRRYLSSTLRQKSKLTYFGTVRGRFGYTQEGWLLGVPAAGHMAKKRTPGQELKRASCIPSVFPILQTVGQ